MEIIIIILTFVAVISIAKKYNLDDESSGVVFIWIQLSYIILSLFVSSVSFPITEVEFEKEIYPLSVNGSLTNDYYRIVTDGILLNFGLIQEVVPVSEVVYSDKNAYVLEKEYFNEKLFPHNILLSFEKRRYIIYVDSTD